MVLAAFFTCKDEQTPPPVVEKPVVVVPPEEPKEPPVEPVDPPVIPPTEPEEPITPPIGPEEPGEETGLKGTTWKLSGFMDVETGNLKVAKPNDPRCYILTFDTDSTFSGISSTNEISGGYCIDYEKSTLNITRYGGTKINELFDGKLFVNSFLSVQSFSLSGAELKLYYNNGENYLLYKTKEL